MGGYAYIQDRVVKVALVPSEEHAHLLRDAPGCSAIDEELALRLTADRWGAPTEARTAPSTTNARTPPLGPAVHAARGNPRGGSRATQPGTPATAASITLAPIAGDGDEGVGRSEFQERFDILAVAFEERLHKLMQTQAETAAQVAEAKLAEKAAFEAAQQETIQALRQQQQVESERMAAMMTRLGTVETQLSATQVSAEQAAAGHDRMMGMLQMLCESADDTKLQLRRLSGGADKQLTDAAPADRRAVCPRALADPAPTSALG